MDLRLAAELGLDRDDAEAARLAAAVAASLAHALVDVDPLGRVGRLAALSLAAKLRGALLVMDQDRDALGGRELALGVHQLATVAHVRDVRQLHAAVAPEVLGGDDDPADALELEQARQLRHRQGALDLLAAGHRHGVVVEELVGHVDARRHGSADGERAGVVERAVAEVLHEVLALYERRHPDPLRSLSAHLRDAGDVAPPLGV